MEVVQKDIKNIHLSVYPPVGRVRISAPLRMELDTIRVYVISKLSWIKKQREKIQSQPRETPREYIGRESHYFMGQRYLLKIIEADTPPKIEKKHRRLEMTVRPGTGTEKRKRLLENWYRSELKSILPEMIAKWEKRMGVEVKEYGIKKMKTKWGTCTREASRIWLNLELAKKPVECLEYIVVHEMVHFFERRHNARFVALMDHFLPQWRVYRDELNRLPVSHVEWGY